jgi:hypothetical protein
MYSSTIHIGGSMKATVVDLRYHMSDVLKALDRNESVSVLFRGKVKGVIRSVADSIAVRVKDHPFFGMNPDAGDVNEIMERLRGGRQRGV